MGSNLWSWHRTAQGQAQERLANLVDLLIDHIDAQLRLIGLDNGQVAQNEEPGRDQVPGSLSGAAVREQVAGKLLVDETVERPVDVERPDHVIAISPGVLGEDVVGRADLVGIARQVQPVPGPALAECRRCQKPIDDAFLRLKRLVVDERSDLLGRWRQAGEVERDAAQPGVAIGVWGGTESLRVEPGEEEPIHLIAGPGSVPDEWNPGVSRRSVGPKTAG